MNWVHVDNLVLAHKLAAEALTQKKSCVAVSLVKPNSGPTLLLDFNEASAVFQSGQAYFINDGTAVNLFEWMAPIVS